MAFNWAALALGLAGAGAGYLNAKNKKPEENRPWEPSEPYRHEIMYTGQDLYRGGLGSGNPWGTLWGGMGGRYTYDPETGRRGIGLDRSQAIPNIFPGGGKGLTELGMLMQDARLNRAFGNRPPQYDPRNYDPATGRYVGPGDPPEGYEPDGGG